MNKYTYVHANIREQASWAHANDTLGATEKAIHLVKAAVAKAKFADALETNKIKTVRAVAVIGAGVAGMKAALSLSEKETEVILIEKAPFVGGRVAQWDTLSTTTETGKEIVNRLYQELLTRPNITLMTNAEVISNKGSVGHITLEIKRKPRYIKSNWHHEDLERAIAVCPVEVPDEFEFGLTKRKAIYQNHPSIHPRTALIDRAHCTRCGECEKVCAAIDFNKEEQMTELTVGSILMATGFDSYTPEDGEFGYKQSDKIITLPQFKRMIDAQTGSLSYGGQKVKNIAFIYCVGSRQPEGKNTYCSRNCCTATIHAALIAKQKFGHVQTGTLDDMDEYFTYKLNV